VLYGDKEATDVWPLFNAGCCFDVAERGQAPGGHDLLIELKAWSPLAYSPVTAVSRRADVFGFGGTLENATRTVLGVVARDGPHPWDHATGTGAVTAHPGDYHDGRVNKRNHVRLALAETTGALSPPFLRHLAWLRARARRRDRTPFDRWDPPPFLDYWIQRLSAAIVAGDARRGLSALETKADHLGVAPG
jgi:hypothetical protein